MRGIRYAVPPARLVAAGEPALVPGQLSTPGGAYEWEWDVAGMDSVPDAVLHDARSVEIGLLDTGADLRAPDLSSKDALAFDVVTGSRDVRDASGHGTFVASLAAGSGENGDGVAGFGGDARLLIVKVATTADAFTDVDLAAGILYAVDRGARVLNLSFSGTTPSPLERSALEYAARRGVLLVAAAGNDYLSGNPKQYPAAYLRPQRGPSIGIVVAASDAYGSRASFSSSGSFVSLAAPGVSVFGAVGRGASAAAFPRIALPGSSSGTYGFASGTSFAAPQVAGAAALIWGVRPDLSARQVEEILESTASGNEHWTPGLGYGVLDVGKAVAAALAGAGV